jgi:hypothetical protein
MRLNPLYGKAAGNLVAPLLVNRDFIALGSDTQSHQVLVFPGKPVPSSPGISQLVCPSEGFWGLQPRLISDIENNPCCSSS